MAQIVLMAVLLQQNPNDWLLTKKQSLSRSIVQAMLLAQRDDRSPPIVLLVLRHNPDVHLSRTAITTTTMQHHSYLKRLVQISLLAAQWLSWKECSCLTFRFEACLAAEIANCVLGTDITSKGTKAIEYQPKAPGGEQTCIPSLRWTKKHPPVEELVSSTRCMDVRLCTRSEHPHDSNQRERLSQRERNHTPTIRKPPTIRTYHADLHHLTGFEWWLRSSMIMKGGKDQWQWRLIMIEIFVLVGGGRSTYHLRMSTKCYPKISFSNRFYN